MLGAEDTILAFFISVDYASNRNRAGGACVPFTTHLTLKYALRLGSNAMLQFALKTIRLEREVYAHTAGTGERPPTLREDNVGWRENRWGRGASCPDRFLQEPL
jgi:hypothetical protein